MAKIFVFLYVTIPGGAIFHTYPNTKNVPTLDDHIAAAHKTSVRAWVESRGIEYYTASNKEEVDEGIKRLIVRDTEKPILLEVFTDKDIDAKCIDEIIANYVTEDRTLRGQISKKMPENMKAVLKKIIK